MQEIFVRFASAIFLWIFLAMNQFFNVFGLSFLDNLYLDRQSKSLRTRKSRNKVIKKLVYNKSIVVNCFLSFCTLTYDIITFSTWGIDTKLWHCLVDCSGFTDLSARWRPGGPKMGKKKGFQPILTLFFLFLTLSFARNSEHIDLVMLVLCKVAKKLNCICL